MNTKICNKCKIEKSVDAFHKASRNRDGCFHTCKACRVSIDKQYYKTSNKKQVMISNRKEVLEKFKTYKSQQKCCICEEQETCCLDFHHLDKEEKKFTIAERVHSSTTWEYLLNEIKKCVVLCANCHRKVENNILELPTDFGAGSTKAG